MSEMHFNAENMFTDGDIEVMVTRTQAGDLVTSSSSEQTSQVKEHGDAYGGLGPSLHQRRVMIVNL